MDQTRVTRVVLDILKHHEPPLTEFALYLGELEGVKRIEITVEEMDDTTVSLEMILFGDIDFEDLRAHLAA